VRNGFDSFNPNKDFFVMKEFVQLWKIYLLKTGVADELIPVFKQILIEELNAVQTNNEVRITTDVLNFAQDVFMLFKAMLPEIERERHQ
jgi:hypothetical protein